MIQRSMGVTGERHDEETASQEGLNSRTGENRKKHLFSRCRINPLLFKI